MKYVKMHLATVINCKIKESDAHTRTTTRTFGIYLKSKLPTVV